MERLGKKGELVLRYTVFFGGMTLLAIGIVLCIQAQLGVSSWDVLQIGLSNVTPLTIGAANIAVGVTLVLITIILDRKRPTVGCLINMVYVGVCIDLIFLIGWIPVFHNIVLKSLMMLIGIVMMGFGSGMYVMAKRGTGPRDGLTLALCRITGWSVRKVRTLLEVLVLIIGWLLGGPVFIGTLIAALLFGPVMQLSMKLWETWIERLLGKGVSGENINEGTVRLDGHDGLSRQVR